MIVDDDPEILEKTRLYLEDDEFDVVTAANSRQALEFLEEDKEENVDLILIDTPIPCSDKNGFFSMKPKSKIHTAEADSFLQKPFTREQLIDFIKKGI